MFKKLLLFLIVFFSILINSTFVYSNPVYSYVNDTPMIISWPLTKAYPGIEYNIRLGVVGGKYPYTYQLLQKPSGMSIDNRGEIVWIPDISLEGTSHNVEVEVTDELNQKVTQSFTLDVTKNGFYFVDDTGNDAGTGTINDPWKNITLSMSKGTNNDILYFREGVYKQPPGFEVGYINKLIAFPGEYVELNFTLAGALSYKIAEDYTYVDGFEVYDIKRWGFWFGGKLKGVTIRRNHMHHLYDPSTGGNPSFVHTRGLSSLDPKDKKYGLIVQDNLFHDLYDRGSGINGDNSANYHGGGTLFYDTRYSLVEDNTIYNIDGACIRDKDGSWKNTIRGNIIQGGCYYEGIDIIGNEMERNMDVLYNVVYNPKLALRTGIHHMDPVINLSIWHNTFIGKINFQPRTADMHFFDNVVYNPQTIYSVSECSAYGPTTNRTAIIEIKELFNIDNNLFYLYDPKNMALSNENTCTGINTPIYYNISQWQNETHDENSLFEEIYFYNYSNFNFSLYSDSLACGNAIYGTDIGALDCLNINSDRDTGTNPPSNTNPNSDYTNPVLYYDFNEIDDKFIHDKSGYNNRGYFEGGAKRVSNGFEDKGVFFDYYEVGTVGNSESYSSIVVPHKNSINLDDSFTFSGFFKFTGFAASQGLFSKGSFGTSIYGRGGNHGRDATNKTRLNFRFKYSDYYLPNTGYIFSYNTWEHLTFVYDKNIIKTFVNGELKYEKSVSNFNISSTSDLIIGYALGNQNDLGGFLGYIDEFRIYDFALNDANVSSLYNSTISGVDLTPPSQVINLQATNLTNTSVNLIWNASTDNIAVQGYKIFRNNTQIADITQTNFFNSNLIVNTSYSYKIQAYDTSNNLGIFSDILNVYTGKKISNIICGNNITETNETCDGSDLTFQTCQSLGFDSGTLSCLNTCQDFDTSLCSYNLSLTCGNNTIEGSEKCDGTDLNGATCQSLGFDKGTLSCKTDCTDYITSFCSNDKNNGGSGNGGGGGSSSFCYSCIDDINITNTCIPLYQYSEWSACIDNLQSRFVEDLNNCEGDDYEQRSCQIELSEEENLILNAKLLTLNTYANKKYKTSLDSGYNEIFYLEEQLEDNIFLLQDEATGKEYYGQYYDTIEDKYYYTLKRVDAGYITILQDEGIFGSSFRGDKSEENNLLTYLAIGFVIILFVGSLGYAAYYFKKTKG